MDSPRLITAESRLRTDLAVAEFDDELVVFDPAKLECHVLSGGAVVVWRELRGRLVAGLHERIAQRLGEEPPMRVAVTETVLQRFADLGLFDSTTRECEC